MLRWDSHFNMLDKALVLAQFRFFFQNFPKSLSEAIKLSQIGDIPCQCLPKFLALEVAKSSLGLQNLTLGVQVQPQNNTKCRPCLCVLPPGGFCPLNRGCRRFRAPSRHGQRPLSVSRPEARSSPYPSALFRSCLRPSEPYRPSKPPPAAAGGGFDGFLSARTSVCLSVRISGAVRSMLLKPGLDAENKFLDFIKTLAMYRIGVSCYCWHANSPYAQAHILLHLGSLVGISMAYLL